MDQKLLKGINHVIKDLKDSKEVADQTAKDSPEHKDYFEGESTAYQNSIELIERILSDYEKRKNKKS